MQNSWFWFLWPLALIAIFEAAYILLFGVFANKRYLAFRFLFYRSTMGPPDWIHRALWACYAGFAIVPIFAFPILTQRFNGVELALVVISLLMLGRLCQLLLSFHPMKGLQPLFNLAQFRFSQAVFLVVAASVLAQNPIAFVPSVLAVAILATQQLNTLAPVDLKIIQPPENQLVGIYRVIHAAAQLCEYLALCAVIAVGFLGHELVAIAIAVLGAAISKMLRYRRQDELTRSLVLVFLPFALISYLIWLFLRLEPI